MDRSRSRRAQMDEADLDEEQLLAMQEQFLMSRVPSAAKAVRKGEDRTNYNIKTNENFVAINYEPTSTPDTDFEDYDDEHQFTNPVAEKEILSISGQVVSEVKENTIIQPQVCTTFNTNVEYKPRTRAPVKDTKSSSTTSNISSTSKVKFNENIEIKEIPNREDYANTNHPDTSPSSHQNANDANTDSMQSEKKRSTEKEEEMDVDHDDDVNNNNNDVSNTDNNSKGNDQSAVDALLQKCRFDFQGKMLTVDEQKSLPTFLGLHHHGRDPGHAGYTFDEIFLLVRSTVPAQRSANLKILTAIIAKAKSNYYTSQIGASVEVLPYLVKNYGLIPIIRNAIDDKNFTAMMAGLQLLHAFVVSKPDEKWEDLIEKSLSSFPSANTPTLSFIFEEYMKSLSKMDLFNRLDDMFHYENRQAERLVLSILVYSSSQSISISKDIAQSTLLNTLRMKCEEMAIEGTPTSLSQQEREALNKYVQYLDGLL